MIKTIEISSVDSATKLLFDQEYNDDIKRLRSPFLFRGINNSEYKLQTSLKTNCKEKQRDLEYSILENFTKYAVKSEPSMQYSIWSQMAVGQHYGLPTRLMDWTHSALVALHFATAEWSIADTDLRDGVVWRIDPRECNRLLPEKYQNALQERHTCFFNIESLQNIAPDIDSYDADVGNAGMVFLEPPSIDQRIINQYAYFSIIPGGMDDIEDFLDTYTENTYRYIIRKDVRWDLRDLLDQFNVSERIVYPGLDGLSMWIARHYYVKG